MSVEYDAFGAITAETHFHANGTAATVEQVDILFGYTGRQFDEATGLQNNLNRWYDPVVGRWISQDPIGFAAGDANLYRYVGNSPTDAVDPNGLWQRDNWSGKRGEYSGFAYSEYSDTQAEDGLGQLAELITGNAADARLLKEIEVPMCGRIDISPLLRVLETRLRNQTVMAARELSMNGPSFGGPSVDDFVGDDVRFTENQINDLLVNPGRCATDCSGAAWLALNVALVRAYKPGEYDKVFGPNSKVPLQNQKVAATASFAGDWGRIHNDRRYRFTRRQGRIGGPWGFESVITSGGGRFIGFPLGEKTLDQWIQILANKFNDELAIGTKPATKESVRGWSSNNVRFLDVAEIAGRRFDRLQER